MLVTKINKIVLVIFFLLTLFMAQGYSAPQEEAVTITTYYPSPAGVYKSLKLFPSSGSSLNASCLSSQEGEMFYNKDDHILLICSKGKWQALPGTGGTGTPAGLWQECRDDANSICTYYSNIAIKGAISEENPDSKPYGGIDVKDVWLRDANNGIGVWAAEAMRAGLWDLRERPLGERPVLFPKNSGNVGLGTQSPSAKLTIQGSGNTSAGASLRIRQYGSSCDIGPVGTSLIVRNDGRVGILLGEQEPKYGFGMAGCQRNNRMDYLLGDRNPPLASLHLRGKLRIEDEQPQIDKTDMLLTSDVNGVGSWRPQEDKRPARGLYGYCRDEGGFDIQRPAKSSHCESELPASCVNFSCQCPAGYERLFIDGGDEGDAYSCYKTS